MAVDPALSAEALLLIQAQSASREQINVATQAAVVTAVRAFAATHWYDHDAITRLAKSLAASTRAGQRQTATSTAAYWSRITSLVAGRRVPPARLIDTAAVRPVPLDVVYGRLADQYRWLSASRGVDVTPAARLDFAVASWTRRIQREAALSDPALPAPSLAEAAAALEDISATELAARLDRLIAEHPVPDAPPDPLTPAEIADRVVERAATIADGSLTLAMRAQMERAAHADPRTITGYRRIIHPERTKSGMSCGLCVAASTRIYHKADLLPIHGHCACSVMGIVGEHGGDGDIGGAINEADLLDLYTGAGGSTAAAALKRTRYRIDQHPELGPRLVPERTFDTVPAKRGRAGKPTAPLVPTVDAEAVLRTARTSIADLERRQAAGENVAGPLKFQHALADRMAALAA